MNNSLLLNKNERILIMFVDFLKINKNKYKPVRDISAGDCYYIPTYNKFYMKLNNGFSAVLDNGDFVEIDEDVEAIPVLMKAIIQDGIETY